jgi:chromosome partitioning protein
MITVIGSLKGGSGKSTLTFNLAVWLAMAEVKVQLVDADPQATLTDVVDVRLEEGFSPKLKVKGKRGLTSELLATADETLIDIGTADMDSLRMALKLCDRVVVPVPPSQADIWSTQRFIHLVESTVPGTPPKILGFINRGDTHHSVRETNETAAPWYPYRASSTSSHGSPPVRCFGVPSARGWRYSSLSHGGRGPWSFLPSPPPSIQIW